MALTYSEAHSNDYVRHLVKLSNGENIVVHVPWYWTTTEVFEYVRYDVLGGYGNIYPVGLI